jgi:hypothetical protein
LVYEVKPRQLDYFVSDNSFSRWRLVVAVIGIQAVWYLVWICIAETPLEDGLPKKPFRDFLLIVGAAVPAIVAIVLLSVAAIRQWNRHMPVARRLPILIGLLFSLLALGLTLLDWFAYDVLHRSEPHGLM